MSKIIAIDFGEKRIGLAASDEMKTIAFPYKTIAAGKNPLDSAKKIAEEIKKEPFTVERIIIGLPLLFSGVEGLMAKRVKEFGVNLENELSIPVEYIDERLTSKAADVSMKELKMKRKKRTQHLDTISAVLILQTYLDKPK